MLKEVRTWYCDACGEIIREYCRGDIDVIQFDKDGWAHSIGFNFCKKCMRSFVEWKESQKRREEE